MYYSFLFLLEAFLRNFILWTFISIFIIFKRSFRICRFYWVVSFHGLPVYKREKKIKYFHCANPSVLEVVKVFFIFLENSLGYLSVTCSVQYLAQKYLHKHAPKTVEKTNLYIFFLPESNHPVC